MFVRFCVCLFALSALTTPLYAQALWIEDAESGYANVNDFTHGSYDLIQSQVAGQGDYAFHLAHPNAADNWFEIDQSISVQNNSKLFFLSRLAGAGNAQYAEVQISTDGGSSWPNTLYSQQSTTVPEQIEGEGAFSLREIDLSSYADQDVRFRFFYDLQFGTYTPSAASNAGWFIDNIQIADEFQKELYSIGNPSAEEQLYLEYINRARGDAFAEATRLANETNSDIQDAYDFFNIQGQDIVDQFHWYVNNGHMDLVAQPLAFNAALNQAAELHSKDMLENEFQGHDSEDPDPPLQSGDSIVDRVQAFGYSYMNLGENVYSYAESVAEGHAGFNVDWGDASNSGHPAYNPAFLDQGMQNPAGHRMNIHNDAFKEIGIGVVNGTNGTVGPQVVTQDFASPGDATFITGVVYEDLNANNFYDLGEGRSGVRIDVDGSAYYAVSSDSGGYSLPVVGDGTYNVAFSGGGFAAYTTTTEVMDGDNVKVDYLAITAPSFEADFDGDGDVDGDDLTHPTLGWQARYGDDLDGNDFLTWQRQYGSSVSAVAVPEPITLILMVGLAGILGIARPQQVRTR